jgi:hypothetical protein
MARRFGRLVSSAVVAAVMLAAWGSAAYAAAAPDAIRAAGPAAAAPVVLKIRIVGLGTVTSTPAGLTCSSRQQPCEATFPSGSQVTLNTVGEPGTPGWVWHAWNPEGACANVQTPTCSITLNSAFTEIGVLLIGMNYGGARFRASWRGNTLRGNLVVQGAVSHEANVGATMISAAGKRRNLGVASRVPAGEFTRTFPLPRAGFGPGPYRIQLESFVVGRQLPAQTYTRVNLPAPREGYLARAWVSSIGSRAAVRRLPRRSPGATAHFVFAFRPARGSRITTSWFLGGRALGTVRKAISTEVVSSVILPGGLPNGNYRCVLKVRGRTLSTVRVRIG